MYRLSLALTLILLSVNASSQITVKDLMDYCDKKSGYMLGVCEGYFTGYRDMQVMSAAMMVQGVEISVIGLGGIEKKLSEEARASFMTLAEEHSASKLGCVNGKSVDQLAKVFIKWAKENPQTWHMDYLKAVMTALSTSFPPPCKIE